MNVEEMIIGKGYELVEDKPPFRVYEKHRKRVVYHVPSDRIWNEIDLDNLKEGAKE